jgi:hypothetical protein
MRARSSPLVVVLATATVMSCGGDTPATPRGCPPACADPKAITVTFAGGVVASELATTRTSRDTGLMNRTSIAADSGMLFVWAADQNPQVSGFWMLNTHFDLSVAFLDSQKRVLNVEDMTKDTQTLHFATGPFRYAVETRKGWFASHGVVAGSVAAFTIPAGVTVDP